MWFWWGYDVNAYLFKNWSSDTLGQYMAWLVGIFLVCILIEVLLYARTALHHRTINKLIDAQMGNLLAKTEVIIEQPWDLRLKITLIYGLLALLSMAVMLLVMTFNVGSFVTVCLGLALGKALPPKVQPVGHMLSEFTVSQAAYKPVPEKCCS